MPNPERVRPTPLLDAEIVLRASEIIDNEAERLGQSSDKKLAVRARIFRIGMVRVK